MNRKWKRSLDRVLQEGEMFGLVFMALMLIVIEGCLVYWLHHLQFPERPVSPLGFLVMPPWYQKPRFEVTLLLTIAAGAPNLKAGQIVLVEDARGKGGLGTATNGQTVEVAPPLPVLTPPLTITEAEAREARNRTAPL